MNYTRRNEACQRGEGVNEGGIETFDSSENTIAFLGDGWWPRTAKQDRDEVCKQFLCNLWKKRQGLLDFEGVAVRSWHGASFRKGFVFNGQGTEARTNEYVTPRHQTP